MSHSWELADLGFEFRWVLYDSDHFSASHVPVPWKGAVSPAEPWRPSSPLSSFPQKGNGGQRGEVARPVRPGQSRTSPVQPRPWLFHCCSRRQLPRDRSSLRTSLHHSGGRRQGCACPSLLGYLPLVNHGACYRGPMAT